MIHEKTPPQRQMLLRIGTIVFPLLLAANVAVAQQLIVQRHSDHPDIATDAGGPRITTETQTPAYVGSATSSDCGLWFLSTHCSPQSFDHSCPAFHPSVLRYDECVGYRNSSYQEMIASLEPGVPVCIMIHGSFVDRPGACREAVQTLRWIRSASLGQRMQMIYFSWPSYRPLRLLTPLDTNILGRRAARNGYYLAEMLQHIPSECSVCLLGHSHGTRVAAAALHMLAGGAIQGVCHPYARLNGRQIRTVFFASAIDHHWLNPGQRYDRALSSTQGLLNFRNHHDPALAVYPLRLPLLTRRAMGMSGLTKIDRRRLGPYGNRVCDYNATSLIGPSHLWPYFFTKCQLAMIMRNYVYFPDQIRSATAQIASASDQQTTAK